MKTIIDDRLRREAARFRFRFSCEHCVHYDDRNDACAEGYPNDEHRDGTLSGEAILFCKLFEGA